MDIPEPASTRRLWLAVIGLAVAMVAIAISVLQYDLFAVRSTPMAESLLPGERAVQVAVDEASIQRGDVVAFRGGSWDGDQPGSVYAMRIIGLPGDDVACDQNGRLQVNGKPITEKYATADSRVDGKAFEAVVPAGRYFVMGDNRLGSLDSRARAGTANRGTIPLDLIDGRLIAVALPVWHFKSLSPGDTFAAAGPTANDDNFGLLIGLQVATVLGLVLAVLGFSPWISRRVRRRRLQGRRAPQ